MYSGEVCAQSTTKRGRGPKTGVSKEHAPEDEAAVVGTFLPLTIGRTTREVDGSISGQTL